MEYLFLIYGNPQRSANATPEDREHAMGKHWAIMDDASSRGILRGAAPLEPLAKAVTVRGDVAMDGPFAETKEHLGGYYHLACASIEEARGWAERISDAVGGAPVEIRGIGAVPARPAHA